MTAVVLAKQAEFDLLEIWLYISNDSLPAANRQLEVFREKFALLGNSPFLGTSCSELAPELRYWTAGNYVIYYRVEEDVIVARVVHSCRKLVWKRLKRVSTPSLARISPV